MAPDQYVPGLVPRGEAVQEVGEGENLLRGLSKGRDEGHRTGIRRVAGHEFCLEKGTEPYGVPYLLGVEEWK